MTFHQNKLYKVKFYDHAIGINDKMICENVGWLVKEDEHHIVLSHWRLLTGDDETKRHNVEYVSIIKSCIIKVRLMK